MSSDLREDAITMPEVMKRNGYETAAFVGSVEGSENGSEDLRPKYNLDQGFQTYKADGRYFESSFPEAKGWIDEKVSGKPLFVFIPGYDVHDPYGKPTTAGERKRFTGDYSGC
ncbi:MAG: hypothetical protein ABEJ99_02060 [Candidatus Nanohaloarchaea archaeon]